MFFMTYLINFYDIYIYAIKYKIKYYKSYVFHLHLSRSDNWQYRTPKDETTGDQ